MRNSFWSKYALFIIFEISKFYCSRFYIFNITSPNSLLIRSSLICSIIDRDRKWTKSFLLAEHMSASQIFNVSWIYNSWANDAMNHFMQKNWKSRCNFSFKDIYYLEVVKKFWVCFFEKVREYSYPFFHYLVMLHLAVSRLTKIFL